MALILHLSQGIGTGTRESQVLAGTAGKQRTTLARIEGTVRAVGSDKI